MRFRLLATAAVVALAASLSVAPSSPAQAAPATTAVLFPSDQLTVEDPSQATGRRLALPLPDCDVFVSTCHELRLLNQLDGFDLDPVIVLQLAEEPGDDLAAEFDADRLRIEPMGGGKAIGLNRFVYDPETSLLYGQPVTQLDEATTYRVVFAADGCESTSTFTTLSATSTLDRMRAQLDDGSAFESAGIGADARSVEFEIDGERRVYLPTVAIGRRNQTQADGPPDDPEPVPTSMIAGAGRFAFGFFRSPSWLDDDQTIPQVPTRTGTPRVTGFAEVGVTLVLPAGPPPEGGWPVAIFGPGITRSKYDLFLAGDLNPTLGLVGEGIATMSLDPVGHSFGPETKTVVAAETGPEEFSGFGRGRDLDGDGTITDEEGISAPVPPHPKSSIALRDGLRQTAADVMTLVRAIERGVDVDGDGGPDLAQGDVRLYAQSLGAIYGTMVTGTDPKVQVAALNVPGGPILEIARLAPGFRPRVAAQLRDRIPGRLNGGIDGFTESAPLYGEDPVTEPAEGAVDIQRVAARVNWLNRPGSPEAFAPKLRHQPGPGGPKDVIYQFAHGDQTVPNPTSATIMRAGRLEDRTSFYRNDKTATRDINPHGFLLDPRSQGRNQGQLQILRFLVSEGEEIIDPDGPLPTWEVPIEDTQELHQRNFPESLYHEPTDAPDGQGGPPEPLATVAPAGCAPATDAPADDGTGAGDDSAPATLPATGTGAGLPALLGLGAGLLAFSAWRRRPIGR